MESRTTEGVPDMTPSAIHAQDGALRYENKRAVVIGGLTGIGAAVTRAFAREGAAVLATGVSEEQVAAAGKLERVRAFQLDVRDAPAVERFAGGVERLDALVNCAGVIRRGGREFRQEEFEEVIDVNLAGAMRVATAFKDALARGAGSIVHVGSVYSVFGAAHAPAYSASKGGLVQLTRSLAIAWAPDGIRVNAVAPGWIATDFTAALRDDPKRDRRILERTPLGRWGTAEDVAGPILFLCSPAAAFVTGSVLAVDGGYGVA